MPRNPKPPSAVDGDLTFVEFCRLLNIGATKASELIRSGAVESYKLGDDRRSGRRIVRESVERLRRGRRAVVLKTDDPVGWTPPEAA